jgi:hypothetical protein
MVATFLSNAGELSLRVLLGRIKPRPVPAAPARAAARRSPAPPPVVVQQPIVRAPMPTTEPDLQMLVWDGSPVEQPAPRPATRPATPPAATRTNTENRTEALRGDPLRQRLRDRYIKARFPGVAECGADLENTPSIVKAVRHYFEEQKFDRADELLELAIAQAPGATDLRLAQLELAFLRRQAAAFTVSARAFRNAHPMDPAWKEICRLGRAIAPAETTLFGDTRGERLHDRYGPWPDMPNWLQASWDLTPEILAADLHREMAQAGVVVRASTQRSAA